MHTLCVGTMYLQNPINLEVIESISILFGIGNLLLWCGLFGLLKYFESLNVSVIVYCTNLGLLLQDVDHFATFHDQATFLAMN